jgi:hypothetical protein
LAVTSTVANAVSESYNKKHSELAANDPLVLLAGFRAAGWICCGVLGLSAIIAIFGWRGVGMVGQSPKERHTEKIGMVNLERSVSTPHINPAEPTSSTPSINTIVADPSPNVKKNISQLDIPGVV